MAIDYKVHKTLMLILVILNIFFLSGLSDDFGFSLNNFIFGTIMIRHILAVLDLYIIWVLVRRL